MNSTLGSPTSLLFTDNNEVSIPVAKIAKTTPASKNHAKSTIGLLDSTQIRFELKSTTGSPTMNSTQKNIEVDNRFADFQTFCMAHKKLEVGKPNADYEQCLHSSEVDIRFANFHPSPVRQQLF